jgi:hypothetical protein
MGNPSVVPELIKIVKSYSTHYQNFDNDSMSALLKAIAYLKTDEGDSALDWLRQNPNYRSFWDTIINALRNRPQS